jgi:hypothetical protein
VNEPSFLPLHLAAGMGASRVVADPAELVCVFEPEVQVVCLRREPDPDISGRLDRLACQGKLTNGFRITLPGTESGPATAFPDGPLADTLQSDLTGLQELFADLIGCPAMGVRLELISRAMCPRFHVDKVGLRLLCTYRGAATEWLDDRSADRGKLGAGADWRADQSSGLIQDAAGILQAAPFDLVLLKGSAWPGNESRGAIHRSPAVTADEAPRVLLAIDGLWTDD